MNRAGIRSSSCRFVCQVIVTLCHRVDAAEMDKQLPAKEGCREREDESDKTTSAGEFMI